MDTVGVVNRFHRIIFAWNYFDLTNKDKENKNVCDGVKEVPKTFESIKHYKEIFEPLVLEECAALCVRGVEEGAEVKPHQAVVSQVSMKDEFLYARLTLPAGTSETINTNDLLLLCKENPDLDLAAADELNRRMHAICFCEAHEGEQSVRVKFYLSDDSQAGNQRGLDRVTAVRADLRNPNSCWWVIRLQNMSTITREWVALQHVQLAPFADILLRAQPRAAPESKHLDVPPGMKTTMESTCNPSQMDALMAGLDGTPVVLIQGPPGTGKTRTILNLLSVVMHAANKGALAMMNAAAQPLLELTDEQKCEAWLRASPWLAGDPNPRDLVHPDDGLEEDDFLTGPSGGSDCFGLTACAEPLEVGGTLARKAHVLVCAPSNSALDEIVSRILNSGLMDGDGSNFAPSIVRVGVNAHHSVTSVALDKLVDARLGDKAGPSLRPSERDRERVAVLDEAAIVCSTLSFAGSAIFYRLTRSFDVVVVDEAAQAVEPAILIPMVKGCTQVYLVGDPVQLPATVISDTAKAHGYDTSLFKRLQLGGYPVHVLDTQYRMHPEISAFPSHQFYQDKLLNGPDVAASTARPWHAHACFGPLAFFDVSGTEEVPDGTCSLKNEDEIAMVLALFRALIHRYPAFRQGQVTMAVISPYKTQVSVARSSLGKALTPEQFRMVDVNTIDGFQGREKDVTIFSCVRSRRKGAGGRGIGFVADERRINVGLTRARCSLIVIGNASTLKVNPNWAKLIAHALRSGCFFRPTLPYARYLEQVVEGQQHAVRMSEEQINDVYLRACKPKGGRPATDAGPEGLYGDVDMSADDYFSMTLDDTSLQAQGAQEGVAGGAAKRGRTR